MPKPAIPKRLDDYYARIASWQVAPLWERLAKLVTQEPQIDAVAYLWNYEALRPILLESAELISEEEAERRVLILENPGLLGQSAATNTLFAGLQLILPGETAPSHRHTPSALRFIIESRNAHTFVNGERVEMSPGDLVLTPSWSWHHHSHEGREPVIWLDVLDLPLVRSIGSRFVEHDSDKHAPQEANSAGNSLVHFPFEPARDALEEMRTHTECDASHGFRNEYTDPVTGRPVMPSLSAFLQLLPGGFSGVRYQSSDGAVYWVVSGRGTVTIGTDENESSFHYESNDVFAIPCWCAHAFETSEETVLFSASDRGIQEHLGIWREHRSQR